MTVLLQIHGLLRALQRALEIFFIQQQTSQAFAGFDFFGVEIRGLSQGFNGFVSALGELPQQLREQHPAFEVAGAEGHHFPGQSLGFIRVLGHLHEGCDGEDQLVVFRIQLKRLLQPLCSKGQLRTIQQCRCLQQRPSQLGK